MTYPRGFYWLIPPTATRSGLAGMARPSAREIARLPGQGIGLLVSMLNYVTLDGDTPLSLRAIHLPVSNNDVPTTSALPQIAVACAVMHRWRLANEPLISVAVHCLLGQGRTGMMLACYRGYLLTRHPEDADALAPEDTAMEVGRLLRDLHEERGLGPTAQQVRFAQQFTSWLGTVPGIDFDAQGTQELQWRREQDALSADALSGGVQGRTLWQCFNPDCQQWASHSGGSAAPQWCLSCGQSTR